MNKELITNSPEETEAFGAEVARYMTEDASAPRFIALYGDLGVGKTAFVRGLASVIAPNSIVRSPTFALVNEYRAQKSSLFHFDMYRIEDEDELYSIGFYDYLDRGICVVEWSENIPYALPERYLKIEISKTSTDTPDERRISSSII
jgi:tRNA threonylcarbamoyladenosine biosynthesis protein TsaE